jgi:hypothetical protein
MNMKMDETNSLEDHRTSFDLENDIEIDLPAGAKAGLKDATQDIRLRTDLMNEHLKKSLLIAKSSNIKDKDSNLKNQKKQIPLALNEK